MPRWFTALLAAICLACAGLAAPALAEPAWQPGASIDAVQTEDSSASIAAEAGSGTDAPDPACDLPDLISAPRPLAVPVPAAGTPLEGHAIVPPSPHLALLQRPPRAAAAIA